MGDPPPSERPLSERPLIADRFVPGEGALLTTLVDLIEDERGVDPAAGPPLGENVDWDALERLLNDDERAANVASVTFSYEELVVRITGRGLIELYDDADAVPTAGVLDGPGAPSSGK
jgi:hypothetical protein